ncbi:hypothetical protein Tco_1504148 [Tanacetum coccineum]
MSYAPQQSYVAPIVHQLSLETPTSPDSRLAIITFNIIDDPIECLNKAVLFLRKALTTRYLPTNNQLRIFSKSKTQANILDGSVTIQTRRLPGKSLQTMAYLNADEHKQIDCDIMAANIVLQGLPNDIYALLNHRKTANLIWNMVKELKDGT